MAVIRLTPGLGWHLAGVFSLLVIAAPAAQAPSPIPVAFEDFADRVPAIAASSVATWTRLLAAGGRLTNQERLVVVDASGSVLAQVDGNKRSVLVPEALADRLCSEPLRATLIHNHPEPSGFSAADLDALSHIGIQRVVAIANDGTAFEATAGPSFAEGWAAALRADLPERVHARLVDEALRDGLTSNTLALHEAHLTATILRRLGVIEYRVSPSITARLAFDRNRAVFARVVDIEAAAAAALASAPRSRR